MCSSDLLEVSALSPLEFVHQEFEHPTVKAGLLFFNGLREVDLRVRGFGHHIAALLASPAKAQMSRGGSAALARALEAAVRAAGGDIRLMTEPKRILVESGRAVGIETAEGEVIRARHLVASSLNPHQTFLDLLDDASVPRDIRERAQRFQYNLLAPLFALHLNLNEPPRYRASANHPELAQAFMREVIVCSPLIRTKQAENSSAAPITGRGIRMSEPVADGRKANARRIAPIANPMTRLLTPVAACRPILAVDGVSPDVPTSPANMAAILLSRREDATG